MIVREGGKNVLSPQWCVYTAGVTEALSPRVKSYPTTKLYLRMTILGGSIFKDVIKSRAREQLDPRTLESLQKRRQRQMGTEKDYTGA